MSDDEKIKTLLHLWESENQIKTNKLMVFFLATTILAASLDINSKLGWFVPILGISFSFIWIFCIGRTVAFQKVWKKKIDNLINSLPENEQEAYAIFPSLKDKEEIPWYGKMSSKYILLWPPMVGCIVWLVILSFYVGGLF